MSTINRNLGLKPRSRTRAATHGKTLRTDLACPSCHAHRVREWTANRIVERGCDACFTFWRPNGEPDGTYRDGIGALRYVRCLCPYPAHRAGCQEVTTS